MSLDIDRQRAMAIEMTAGMAQAAQDKGDAMGAAGFYEEAARLLEAHAELAPDEAEKQERAGLAKKYTETARALRMGDPVPGAGPSGGGSSSASGGWEATWTRGQAEGQKLSGPPSDGGAAWEPFAISFSPSDPTTPVIGWRRSS